MRRRRRPGVLAPRSPGTIARRNDHDPRYFVDDQQAVALEAAQFVDEIVELKECDAVRVPPGTWRGYEAWPDGLEILVIGAPNLGEAPRKGVDGQRDWWADY